MPTSFFDGLACVSLIGSEIVSGFLIFWVGQFAYQLVFRRIELNLELFVRDNPAVTNNVFSEIR